MNLQTTGDPMEIENAAISLEVARTALEREGSVAAKTLKGLEVLSPSGAAVALDALRSLSPETHEARVAILGAMDACVEASKSNVAA